MGYAPMNYSGYAGQPMANPQQSIPTPQFTPSRTANYQVPQSTNSFPPSRPFPQPTPTHGPSYQHQPGYSAYGPSTAQQAPTYHSVTPSHQNAPQSVQPSMMGPPMHWGYNNAGSAGAYTGPPHGNQRGPRPYNAYGNQASRGGGAMPHMKRDHASAFGKPQNITPRVPAPPPVPSFGNPLPSKPPPPADATRKPKKKKRKHNQLGLTPKTEEHESSEEEDDVDEESRLAQGGAGAAAAVQFTFKGRTTTLQSHAEIAAWIEERKKRFPTKEKVEEKKKAMEEAKKAKEEAQRHKEARKQEMKKPQKDHQQTPTDPIDAAEKAKRKADKLRRKLMKEQKKVEKAEADAERARMRVEELQRGSMDANKDVTCASTQEVQAQLGPDQETRSSETQGDLLASGHTPGQGSEPSHDVGQASTSESKPNGEDVMENVKDDAAVSSDLSDSSDWTSSSGSDLSSSDSEDSESDSTPEEATSRREGPERVAPPPREAKKKLCRHFARTGRCQRGDKCKFLHEAPDRGAKAKPVEKKGRKGLLQALLDRQKGEDDRKVMEAIVWLGENGLLDETKSHEESLEGANENSAIGEVKSSQGLPGDPPSSEGMVSAEAGDSAPATA
ncbi:hypothetical protein BDV37DRAFT_268370 [Aspergillus pseudonomiae]|uniref:C3H1-type domain-containing protein n=1 Tax=Aspergillus pseudonomiae TaxID=1506151 RepID=A0A5N7DR69_9EURO|nr:uncharacterized protein BDV37DRAFT_268370 [Aspergillus pseudonomiae]KAE8408785.1 hypothetical protein BDV37DRAFT_268370 [Aspergillus pseudonomiae]